MSCAALLSSLGGFSRTDVIVALSEIQSERLMVPRATRGVSPSCGATRQGCNGTEARSRKIEWRRQSVTQITNALQFCPLPSNDRNTMAKPAAALNCLLRPSASQRLSSTISQNVARQSAARETAAQCAARRQPFSSSPRRPRQQPADDPGFSSIVDNPPELVRTGNRHGWGLMVLGATCHTPQRIRFSC